MSRLSFFAARLYGVIDLSNVPMYTSYVATSLKPLSHQTAMPQRLYSVLKPCERAVWAPRNTPKNINFAIYSFYTTSSPRPYSVHTTFPQRLYSVNDGLQRASSCCSVFTARLRRHTAFSRCAHSVLTAIIAFKILHSDIVNIMIYFYFSKQFVIWFISCLNV